MKPILTLTVLGPCDLAPDERTRSLENGRLRIGRDADNDWVIEDPARLISRHHCTVMASGGLFTVIDTSVNGLVINDADRPLGRGNSALLSDGDILHLAGIEVAVALGEASDPARDPLRAVLPPRTGGHGLDLAPGMASGAPNPAAMVPVPSRFPSAPRVTEPPPWLRTDLISEASPPRPPAPVTPDDHIPAERQALQPSTVSPQMIPDDWDADHPPARAPVPPSPVPDPAREAQALALVLVEALGRIATASGEEGAELFQGPPEAALTRLEAADRGWTALILASLSVSIAARLSHPNLIPRAPAPPHANNEAHRTADGDIAP